jgi:hypothetical protein
MRRFATAFLLIGFEIGAVVLLHRLGELSWLRLPGSDLTGWLAVNPPVETIVALTRPFALVAAVWLLFTTVLYGAAHASGRPIATAVAKLTFPPARRLIDGAAVFGMSALIAAGPSPALAVESPVPHLVPESPTREEHASTSIVALERVGWLRAAETTPVVEDTATAERSPTYTVRKGDSLWSIASGRLNESLDTPNRAELARYWRSVVALNAARLRSGDPDLIFPGEVIEFPPPFRGGSS